MKNLLTTTGKTPRDLDKRTTMFARDVRTFVRRLPKNIGSLSDCRRLIRSSGEIGSRYINADESVTKEAFINNISYCCQHSRKAGFWLDLIDADEDERNQKLHTNLLKESQELEKIFGSILSKVRAKKVAKSV